MSNEVLKHDFKSKTKSSRSSTESETDEPPAKKRDSSPSKRSSHIKDVKNRSYKTHRDDRHVKTSSSSHRHSSRSHRDDRHRDHRSHRDHRRDKDSHHKRHSDKHRHERSGKKHRSRSSSSSNSSSVERKSKERRHRSGSRDKTNNSKNSAYVDKNGSVKDKTNTSSVTVNESLAQEGGLNVAEMLKSIEVPAEIRFKPAEAAKYQMDQLRLKAEELTGVKVPSFYNSNAVNPLLYAEQQKKRKLLWSKAKDNGVTTTSIVGRAIVEGQDEKTSEKFRKLMGIKNTDLNSTDDKSLTTELKQRTLKINEVMDKEYELARMSTHTHRGQGLGFATLGFVDPNQRPAH